MKENSDIDELLNRTIDGKETIGELLNGFIDGELTARQQTELQRLINHDPRISQRLQQLRRCKMLVGSLPFDEAPAGMVENIKASLERRTLLGQRPSDLDDRAGARHLLIRRVVASAAMIVLIGALAVVIYTIVAPESIPEKPLIAERSLPAVKVKVEKPSTEHLTVEPTSTTAIAEKPFAATAAAATRFSCRLILKTNTPTVVDAFINRAIEDNDLGEYIGPRNRADKSVYAITASSKSLTSLLDDLKSVWTKLDSATLFIETDNTDRQIVIDRVSAEQITEIVNQTGPNKRIEVAKDFAVLNETTEMLPGKEVLAAIDNKAANLITIPKPVLTAGERPTLRQAQDGEQGQTIKKPVSGTDDEKVYLTIVVTVSK